MVAGNVDRCGKILFRAIVAGFLGHGIGVGLSTSLVRGSAHIAGVFSLRTILIVEPAVVLRG